MKFEIDFSGDVIAQLKKHLPAVDAKHWGRKANDIRSLYISGLLSQTEYNAVNNRLYAKIKSEICNLRNQNP
jgi:hypothetical protein